MTGDLWQKLSQEDQQIYYDDYNADMKKFLELHPEEKDRKRAKKNKKKNKEEEHWLNLPITENLSIDKVDKYLRIGIDITNKFLL